MRVRSSSRLLSRFFVRRTSTRERKCRNGFFLLIFFFLLPTRILLSYTRRTVGVACCPLRSGTDRLGVDHHRKKKKKTTATQLAVYIIRFMQSINGTKLFIIINHVYRRRRRRRNLIYTSCNSNNKKIQRRPPWSRLRSFADRTRLDGPGRKSYDKTAAVSPSGFIHGDRVLCPNGRLYFFSFSFLVFESSYTKNNNIICNYSYNIIRIDSGESHLLQKVTFSLSISLLS